MKQAIQPQMTMTSKRILLIMILLFFTGIASAQQTDFMGTWVVKERTSLTGKNYVNGLPSKLQVEKKQDQLVIHRTIVTDASTGADTTVSEQVPLNGKTISYPAGGNRTTKASLKIDKNILSETGQITAAGNDNQVDFKISQTWTLSADGKGLTIVKSFESTTDPADKWSMRGIYEKQ